MARKKVVVDPIIGQRIRMLRKEKGYTQAELATKLQYDSGNAVLYWENGRSAVPTEILEKIANIFDVSVYYLLGKTNSRISWAKFDNDLESLESLRSEIHRLEVFVEYLSSLGFEFRVASTGVDGDGEAIGYFELTKGEKFLEVDNNRFEIFQRSIAKYIDFEFLNLLESMN